MNSQPNNTQYQVLADRMDRETGIFSFTKEDHPAYIAIVKGGRKNLKLLLGDIKNDVLRSSWRITAICRIAQKLNIDLPEIPEDDQGRICAMREIFLHWAKEHHFI